MSNNDNIPGEGPSGFRRIWDALRGVFVSGGQSSVLTVGANEGPSSPQAKGVGLARLRQADPLVKSRSGSTTDKLGVYDNQIAQLVEARLRVAFHPENFARMFWVMHTSSNVMRRIINDVSVMYENPAARRLKEETPTQTETTGAESLAKQAKAAEGGKPATPEDAAPVVQLDTGDPNIDVLADDLELSGAKTPEERTSFEKLQAAYDLDVLLDTVEKLCMISPVVWVRPVVVYDRNEAGENDAATGRLNFVLYTPAEADVVVDPANPTEAIGFYYFGEELTENGTTRRVIHFWSKFWYQKLDLEWKVLAQEENALGRLPVTPFRLHMPRQGYFTEGVGDDLLEATLEVCVLKTLQNSRAKDSAFKQLAIQGDAQDVPQDIVLGGPSPIILGEDSTASVLDLQSNLEQFTDMWEKREVSLASTYGINAAEYKNEGHPQSGFAKRLDRDKVLKESRRRRKFFARGEQDLYNLTAVTLGVYPIPSIGALDPTGILEVDFAEPTFEEEPQTQARTDAIELKYNVVSIIDILKRRNPDLSDVELIEMAYRNKRINDAFMTSDQMRLVDLLATRANVGGSFGQVGQQGAQPGGEPPEPGTDNGNQNP